MCRVRSAEANATTARRWMLNIRERAIYDVLNMTVEEAMKFFENIPSTYRKIATLNDVGLLTFVWGSRLPSCPAVRHSESSWPQN